MKILKLFIVKSLNHLCLLIDGVLYRPVVVLMGKRLPFWWNCAFGKMSVKLDDRWGLGYWKGLMPGPPCAACGRRASTVYIGGWALEPDYEPEPNDEEDYLERYRVELCQWCFLDPKDYPISSKKDLQKALDKAAAMSISWRWRWKTSEDLWH